MLLARHESGHAIGATFLASSLVLLLAQRRQAKEIIPNTEIVDSPYPNLDTSIIFWLSLNQVLQDLVPLARHSVICDVFQIGPKCRASAIA